MDGLHKTIEFYANDLNLFLCKLVTPVTSSGVQIFRELVLYDREISFFCFALPVGNIVV